jgi:hypothetical protein
MAADISWAQARQYTRHLREPTQPLQSRTQSLPDRHKQVNREVRALLDAISARQDVQEFVEKLRANIDKQ